MKALLIVGINLENFINHRAYHLLDYLIKKRYDVTIIRRISSKEVKGLKKLFPIFKEYTYRSNRIYAIKSLKTPIKPQTSRAIFAACSFARHVNESFDLCITQGPWAGVVGYWLKKFKIVKFLIYEDLDLFVGFGQNRSRKRIAEIEMMERISLQQSDIVVSISRELKQLREQQTSKPVVYIPNGVIYDRFAKVFTDNRPQDCFTLIYTGSLAEWSGLELAIAALPKLSELIPNIRLVVVGTGPRRYEDALLQEVRRLGMESRVSFLGKKPYEELPNYLAQAHLGIATFPPSDLMKYAFTLKVIEYMAAGIPVIASNFGETGKLIEESKAGIAIEYSIDGFVEAVMHFFNNPEILQSYSKSGTTFAKNYDWNKLFNIEFDYISHFLKNIC